MGNTRIDPSPEPSAAGTERNRAFEQLAAIDMGSNSFRLEIAQVQQGRYRRIEYDKETVRLGAGLDADGQLTEEAMQRGLSCLGRFAVRLAEHPPGQIRAVATQTLREARNRNEFLARAQTVLGHPIEVISGREEARLIYAGVARLQPSERPRLVIDIGGRSTEMILGRGRTPLRAESFQVGSVSLSMQHFPDGRYTEEAFRTAQVAAGAELEEALEPFAAQHWQEALGSSGTVGAVSQLLAASHVTDGSITPDGLRWLMLECLKAGRADRLTLPGLKEDRRAVIAGGLSILYTLAVHFDIAHLQPARGALRQGVVFDLSERRGTVDDPSLAHDARDTSVRRLQERFAVDLAQASRVTECALRLHAGIGAAPGAVHAEATRELRWACALHEVGMMISHHDHHRHAAYVLAHVDAAGFSQSQQHRLSELALAQRGGLRKVEASLGEDGFALQALCLRLAVILCHAREPADPAATRLLVTSPGMGAPSVPGGTRAELLCDPAWAQTHPRTLYLLAQEPLAWAKTVGVAFGLRHVVP